MSHAADKAQARHARRIVAAFREGVARARARVDRQALVDAIARGDKTGASRMVSSALAVEAFRAVEAAWNNAAVDQGTVAADEAPDLPVRKRLTFNPFASVAIYALWAAQLGRSLYNLALQAIDSVLGTGMDERLPAQQLADDVLAVMGLFPHAAAAVLNYRRSLTNLDRAALRSQLRDARNDPRILSAIREMRPLSPDYVDNLVARYAKQLEAGRAVVIGQTEAARARSTGEYGMWLQQIDAGLVDPNTVVKVWHHKHDSRVRDTHLSIPSIQPEGVPFGGVFVTSAGNRLRFPHDPAAPIAETIACRCHLTYEVRTT